MADLKGVILQIVRSLSKYGTVATRRVNRDWAGFQGDAMTVLRDVGAKRATDDKDEQHPWAVLAVLAEKNRDTEVAPYIVLARRGGKLLSHAMEIYRLIEDKTEFDLFARDHLRDLFQPGADTKQYWTTKIRTEAAVAKADVFTVRVILPSIGPDA